MMINKYGRVAGSIDLAALAQMYAETDDDDDLRAHYREVAAEHGVDLDAGQEAPEPEPESDEVSSGEPPRRGPGSGRDEWVAYATSQGVEVTDDMTRDDIVAAVDEED